MFDVAAAMDDNDISLRRPRLDGLVWSVRIATAKDHGSLLELINRAYEDAHWFKQPCFYNRVTEASLSQYLNMPNGHFLMILLTETKRVIASLLMRFRGAGGGGESQEQEPEEKLNPTIINTPILCISLISIDPEFQRRGIGRFMLELACSLAQQQRHDATDPFVQIEVVSVQDHLLAIYKSWGFQAVSKITWEQVGVDSKVNIKVPSHLVVMQRKLRSQ